MTETISVSRGDGITHLKLSNGVTNALSPQLVSELQNQLNESENASCGLIISGGEKFFSMGLDLPSLLKLSREEMAIFWKNFNQVLLDIYAYPFPTLCAMEGHAIAGGTILALACDFRIACGDKKMGLNEIHLGLPVPYLAYLLLKQVVGDNAAKQLMYSGEFFGFDQAHSKGLIDRLVEPDELLDEARTRVIELMKPPAGTFAAIKANHTTANVSLFKEQMQKQHQLFLDFWFDEQVSKRLKAAAEKF